jgi:spore coat polysaccharide biosynthesis protein SpsF
MARVIASIEARMGSSRLPGKVLADVCGQPALTRLLRRLRTCKRLDGLILATSTAPADDVLEQWAATQGIPVHRGSEDDVLGRVVEAHQKMGTEVIVEITGDCTLLDPQLIDMGVQTFAENECDVVANVRKDSFSHGMDIQVFRYQDLSEIARTINDPAVREHVSLYFYEHPERYRIIHLFAPERWAFPDYRFMLDYPEDLRFINEIYTRLEPAYGDSFGIEELITLLKNEPELLEINRNCTVKPVR